MTALKHDLTHAERTWLSIIKQRQPLDFRYVNYHVECALDEMGFIDLVGGLWWITPDGLKALAEHEARTPYP